MGFGKGNEIVGYGRGREVGIRERKGAMGKSDRDLKGGRLLN